jgi:hypothetical protein
MLDWDASESGWGLMNLAIFGLRGRTIDGFASLCNLLSEREPGAMGDKEL